ncbi:MAG: peroxiredoxin [Phenylobacterium zucineum]|nr:MAG: peroxiredoxin [Phenylobacterium zucineum]
MSAHRATIDWTLDASAEDFLKGRYSRGHKVTFAEHVVPATASAHVVGAKWAAPGAVDPEEMLVAALSNCHMLTFLHVARLKGFAVTRYRDEAVGVMEKNEAGRMAVTRVTLHPEIHYEGRRPTAEEADHLHHEAHEECFIANSVKTEVVVEEREPAL